MRKKKVLIVEDSLTVRTLLEHVIGNDPRLEVAASVGTAEEALRVMPAVRPDVISLDVRLPGMNGLDATRRIMSDHPTPIVIVSANVDGDDFKISMNALSAGAVTVVEKPVATTMQDYEALAERLCRQLAIMSDVHVIRQRHGRAGMAAAPTAGPAPTAARGQSRPPDYAAEPRGDYRVLGIVASTGGPSALVKLLGALGTDFPLPVVLVQHITPSFMAGFVSWLDEMVPLKVVAAEDGDIAIAGTVYVAPADRHLEVQGGRLKLVQGPAVSSQKPSGTVLLQSLARNYGRHALGVVLTGMGDDGASGLGAVRAAGGHTIAEDESTAVVYGMPAVAVRLGAACEELPLHEIGPRLLRLGGSSRIVP
ncbi:MAG: chemotaxis-specific protein-glutamate methyltransferase CheB [Reyranellaceae bacterium]